MPCNHLIFYHYISSINLCLCLCVLACGRAPYLFLSLSRRGAVCHTMASNQGLFSSCLSLSLPQITTKWATWDFASLFEVLFTLSQLKIEIALSATKIWDDTAGHLLQIASWAMPLSTSIHPSIHPTNSLSRVKLLRAGSYLSMHCGRVPVFYRANTNNTITPAGSLEVWGICRSLRSRTLGTRAVWYADNWSTPSSLLLRVIKHGASGS